MRETIAQERWRRELGGEGGGRMQYEHKQETKTSNKLEVGVGRVRLRIFFNRNGLYLS